MKSQAKKISVIGVIVLLLAASRLVEHPFNFTPIAAMSIFVGCYLKKHWGLILPSGAMLASDFFIGFYDWKLMRAVYVGVGASFYIGWLVREKPRWYSVLLAALSSSLFFFLVSNFAVWQFSEWYPHTISGLGQCYVSALPFFRNSLIGDLVYASVIFAAYELSWKYFQQRLRYNAIRNRI